MGGIVGLTSGDGHGFRAYLAEPGGAPRFGLVVVQEIFGVNAHIRRVCDQFANDGILAIAPALFDRQQRDVTLDYDGDGVARGRALRTALGWTAPLEDLRAAGSIAAIGGRVGVVGYCWGGTLAWLAASRLGDKIAASVGYYGGQIHDFKSEVPKAPVTLHFGDHDPLIPPEHVTAIAAAHPQVPIYRYPAGHGFNCDARGDYSPECARQARDRTLSFLDDALAK